MSQYSGKIDEGNNKPGNKKRKKEEERPPVTSYSPEQIIIPEMPTDAELIEPVPGNIDIASFIDDLAEEGEGGSYDGYVE